MHTRSLIIALCLWGCARKIEGPTPSVTGARNQRDQSTAPALLCNAQGDPAAGWLVDALGDNFAPLPINALSGTPGIAMPVVKLTGPETYQLPDAYVRFADKTRLPLAMRTADSAADPHALLPGDYALTVANLNGASATAPAAIRVIPPPTLATVEVQPPAGGAGSPRVCNDKAEKLVITGANFRGEAKPTLSFVDRSGATALTLPESALTVVTPTQIQATLPVGAFTLAQTSLAGTTYSVTVTDPAGCAAPYGATPRVSGITDVRAYPSCKSLGTLTATPRFGSPQKNQAITIHNTLGGPGTTQPFSATAPQVTLIAPLRGSTTLIEIPLRKVAFLDANTITAVVPTCSGLSGAPSSDPNAGGCPDGIAPGGPYTIEVQDIGSGFGTLSGAQGFVVLAGEAPTIASISPAAVDTAGTADLTITSGGTSGFTFGAAAKAQVVFPAGANQRACDLTINSQTALVIHARVLAVAQAKCVEYDPAGRQVAATGGFTPATTGLYVIRVQNTADPGFGDFSGLAITQPAAAPQDAVPASSSLVTARADFPLVQAGDDAGNRYLYAIGGISGRVGVGTLLSSIEMAQINAFGDAIGDCSGGPCTFRVLDRTQLGFTGGSGTTPEPRRGLVAVSVQVPGDTGYVFIIGGVKGSAAIATVERAQVLRAADAPVIASPIAVTSGGSLAAGTFYYRVSALLAATDSKNPGGETLASELEPITAAAGGKATLSWPCLPGALKYRVFRTAGPNQPAGTERLLAEPAAAAACTGTPLPGESFTDDGSATPAGLRPQPAGALGRWVSMPPLTTPRAQAAARLAGDRLYVAGGCSATNCDATGSELATYESSQLTLDTLGAFGSAAAINHARRQASFALATNPAAPNLMTAGEGWLVLVGGEQNGVVLLNSTGNIEVAHVLVGGALQPSPAFADAAYTPDFGRHGGWTEVIADLLIIFGTNPAGNTIFRSGPLCNAPCANAASFATDLPQTGTTYTVRFLPGEAFFRGFFYAAGGLTDATNTATAQSSVERILY